MSEEKSNFADLTRQLSGVIEKVELIKGCQTDADLSELVDGWELESAELKDERNEVVSENEYLSEQLASFEARIKELEEKLSLYDWKDIESIPRDGTEVLATDGYDVFTVKYVKSKHSIQSGYLARSSNDDFWNRSNGCRHRDERMYVTKWCHKPTPPTQEGDK